MKIAPGFTAYRYPVAVKHQPMAIKERERKCVKRDQRKGKQAFRDGTEFVFAFDEGCCELARASFVFVFSVLIERMGVMDLEKIVGLTARAK